MTPDKKVGRPKRLGGSKRTERVVAMLTPEEKEQLERFTDKRTMSISGALREAGSILYKLSPEDEEGRRHAKVSRIESLAKEIANGVREKEFEIPIELKGTIKKVGDEYIFTGLAREFPKREIAMKLLEELEEKCRLLMESPPGVMFILQADRLKYIDLRRGLHGYEMERLLSEPIFDLAHPDDRALVEERAQRIMKGEEVPQDYVFRGLGKNGEVIDLHISSIRVEYEGCPAIAGSLINITDLEDLEQGIRELKALVDTLSNGADSKES